MAERNTLFDRKDVRHTAGPSTHFPFWVTGTVAADKGIATELAVKVAEVTGRDGAPRPLHVDLGTGFVYLNTPADGTVVVLAKVELGDSVGMVYDAIDTLDVGNAQDLTVDDLVQAVIAQSRTARGMDTLA